MLESADVLGAFRKKKGPDTIFEKGAGYIFHLIVSGPFFGAIITCAVKV